MEEGIRMVELSHRERVEMALNREEPDRVPIEFGGVNNSIYEKPFYWPISPKYGYSALVKYLGLENVPDAQTLPSNCVGWLDERILDRFGGRLRIIPHEAPERGGLVPGRRNCAHRVGREGENGGILLGDSRRPPYGEGITFKDIDNLPAPDPVCIENVRKEVKELREKTNRAIIGVPSFAENIFHRYSYIRGFSNMLLDIKRNPEIFRYLADTILEVHGSILESFFSECGDYVDFALLGDALGTQQAPLRLTRRVQGVHEALPQGYDRQNQIGHRRKNILPQLRGDIPPHRAPHRYRSGCAEPHSAPG